MKTLELNAYGVSEMSQQEMLENEGGGLGDLPPGTMVYESQTGRCTRVPHPWELFFL
jgi:hypothetical protein